MSSITNLVTNAALNVKTNGVKGEILNITNFATTDALATVEKKITDFSDFVKKEDYDVQV